MTEAGKCRKGLKKMHLEVLPGTPCTCQSCCRRIPPSVRKDFPTCSVQELQDYFRRKCQILRSTERYMAGVTRPVWVFCWLGGWTPSSRGPSGATWASAPCAKREGAREDINP